MHQLGQQQALLVRIEPGNDHAHCRHHECKSQKEREQIFPVRTGRAQEVNGRKMPQSPSGTAVQNDPGVIYSRGEDDD